MYLTKTPNIAYKILGRLSYAVTVKSEQPFRVQCNDNLVQNFSKPLVAGRINSFSHHVRCSNLFVTLITSNYKI